MLRYTTSGQLDPTFDGDAVMTTTLGGINAVFNELVLQPDGKIVVAGLRDWDPPGPDNNQKNMFVARYADNGAPDNSFGLAGTNYMTVPVSGNAYTVGRCSDGKIVAAGEIGEQYALARFTPSGQLDTSFGPAGTGWVTHTLGGPDTEQFEAVACLDDGTILAAGCTAEGFFSTLVDAVVFQYRPDGTLDPAFGTGGIVRQDVAGESESLWGTLVQDDGKILVSGHASIGGRMYALLMRFNPDGTLDTSFDGDGIVTDTFGYMNVQIFNNVLMLPSGTIVGVGAARTGDDSVLAMAGYEPDGRRNPNFGKNGVVLTPLEGAERFGASDAAVTYDNKIATAGYATFSGVDHISVVRYRTPEFTQTTISPAAEAFLSTHI